ncbi:MAG: twin-arginine translocase TatA/TatE family subunit [Anaerolineales bacterium]|nr:twin-arginine translocase TatA/TatE family subunit [Anaerolineales bacterium]
MNIFGFGGSEILVILLLAGIVLGPERLARAGRELGKLVRNIKAYLNSMNEELKSELEILDEIKDIQKEMEITIPGKNPLK